MCFSTSFKGLSMEAMDFIGLMVTYWFIGSCMLVRFVLKPVKTGWFHTFLSFPLFEISQRPIFHSICAGTKVLDTLKVTDIAMQIYETSKQAVPWPRICGCHRIGSCHQITRYHQDSPKVPPVIPPMRYSWLRW